MRNEKLFQNKNIELEIFGREGENACLKIVENKSKRNGTQQYTLVLESNDKSRFQR